VAAVFARSFADGLDLPAASFGVAGIHAIQIARKYRRLVATGAGAHFQIDAVAVARIGRHQHAPQIFLAARKLQRELAGLLFA
jgi:hypothetical protein